MGWSDHSDLTVLAESVRQESGVGSLLLRRNPRFDQLCDIRYSFRTRSQVWKSHEQGGHRDRRRVAGQRYSQCAWRLPAYDLGWGRLGHEFSWIARELHRASTRLRYAKLSERGVSVVRSKLLRPGTSGYVRNLRRRHGSGTRTAHPGPQPGEVLQFHR